jgi:hypothetical protein
MPHDAVIDNMMSMLVYQCNVLFCYHGRWTVSSHVIMSTLYIMPGLNDSDPLTPTKKAPDDLVAIALDILGSIQYKFLGLLMIVFIILSSDVFIGRVLSRFQGAVDYKCPTSWGVILQAMCLVLLMMIIDCAIRAEII